MAYLLANILAKSGKEVVFNVVYDATVRKGNVHADIVYSDEPIEVPVFEEADIGVQLSEAPGPSFRATYIILEASICEAEGKRCNSEYQKYQCVPFKKMSIEKFHSPRFANMIALGNLMRKIGIDINTVDFTTEFPPESLEENVKAIHYGYTYQN